MLLENFFEHRCGVFKGIKNIRIKMFRQGLSIFSRGPGFNRMLSGISIFPMSCNEPAKAIISVKSVGIPIASASLLVYNPILDI